MEKPRLDEAKADEFIGKTVILCINYLDHDENLLGQKQWYGIIQTFSNAEGIKIKIVNSDEVSCLPPDPRGFRKAKPGTYTLRSTGEEIEDPDYLSSWTITKPNPNAKE